MFIFIRTPQTQDDVLSVSPNPDANTTMTLRFQALSLLVVLLAAPLALCMSDTQAIQDCHNDVAKFCPTLTGVTQPSKLFSSSCMENAFTSLSVKCRTAYDAYLNGDIYYYSTIDTASDPMPIYFSTWSSEDDDTVCLLSFFSFPSFRPPSFVRPFLTEETGNHHRDRRRNDWRSCDSGRCHLCDRRRHHPLPKIIAERRLQHGSSGRSDPRLLGSGWKPLYLPGHGQHRLMMMTTAT